LQRTKALISLENLPWRGRSVAPAMEGTNVKPHDDV
jgi:hypothetical protein